jgi:hypothetical protein
LVRSITDLYEQLPGLAAVAEALAKAGQHKQAAARSTIDPERQAQTLAAVAEALAARGDTREARLVASAACVIGRWTTVLQLVLALEPPALRLLTDLLVLQNTRT